MQGKFEKDIRILVEQVKRLIEKGDPVPLLQFIEPIHSADLVEILQELDDQYRDKLFSILPMEDAVEVLEDIDTDSFDELLRLMSKEKKTLILDEMDTDDIVDHLGELDEDRQEEILSYMHTDEADDVRELMIYEEDTAGGIMTNEYLTINKNLTVADSIIYLREHAPDAETIYYLYVVNDKEMLRGVISLRDLIISEPELVLKEIMNERVISVNIHDDQEEVARVVSKYDLLAVPVIDNDDIMQGIVTVDDIIDVIEEEATEDILKFAGTSDIEDIEEDSLLLRIRNSIQSRLPWLVITLFGGLLSATIISNYEVALSANAKIAMFIPILAGMGGNVGTQSSTLTVRSIAMGHIQGKEAFRTIFHELTVGLTVGLFCGVLAGAASMLLKSIDLSLAIVVALAMWANMLTAATIGTVVPLIFKKIGVDPAVASAPFITTTVDITGLTIYFTLVMTLMQKIM